MRKILLPIAVALLAYLAPSASAHEQKLEGTEWGIVGEEGEDARFISFAGSGRVFGFGGCNRFSGQYEQHDAHLTISPLAATRMACAADKMQKEAEFLELLSRVRGVRVDHTLLLFLDDGGGDIKALTRRNAPEAGTEE